MRLAAALALLGLLAAAAEAAHFPLSSLNGLVEMIQQDRKTTTPVAACPSSDYGECSAAGTCENGVCRCSPGYQPPLCAFSTLEPCPSQCRGHGACISTAGTDPHSSANATEFVCECDAGYAGEDCGSFTGCQALAFCSGHGDCHAPTAQCQCHTGWFGRDCSQPLSCPNHCSGHGACMVSPASANRSTAGQGGCACDPSFTGRACDVLMPASCPLACSGHGICNRALSKCECFAGFAGPACSRATNVCDSSCGHGECSPFKPNSLDLAPSGPSCVCEPTHTGASCAAVKLAQRPCAALGFCSGNGRCTEVGGKPSCACFAGFTGKSCEAVVSDDSKLAGACENFCSGHGTCESRVEGGAVVSRCVCKTPWEGADCSQPRCPTPDSDPNLICGGRGICEPKRGNATTPQQSDEPDFHCRCDPGYTGPDCTQRAVSCAANCSLHGRCVDGECVCNAGFAGHNCMTSLGGGSNSTQPHVCCPQDCSDNGACDMVGCKCDCNDGWTGPGCETFALGDDAALLEIDSQGH